MAALLIIMVTTASTSPAFDGQRSGFILGLELGPSFNSYTQNGGSRESEPGLATIFRLGGGFNEQSMLYFTANVNWLGVDTGLGGTTTMASSVVGVGYSYYLKNQTPSFFFNAGLGYSSWRAPFDSDIISHTGFGGIIGAGYELNRHLVLELNLTMGSTENKDGGFTTSSDALGVQLTIGYIAY